MNWWVSVGQEGLRRKRIADGPGTRNDLRRRDSDSGTTNVTTSGRVRECRSSQRNGVERVSSDTQREPTVDVHDGPDLRG